MILNIFTYRKLIGNPPPLFVLGNPPPCKKVRPGGLPRTKEKGGGLPRTKKIKKIIVIKRTNAVAVLYYDCSI